MWNGDFRYVSLKQPERFRHIFTFFALRFVAAP